jgi:hypothetical protein
MQDLSSFRIFLLKAANIMTQQQWSAVDRYIAGLLVPADPALDAALEASAAAGLPSINVAPNQGKLLNLLAKIQGARTILEIGTLGGYSTMKSSTPAITTPPLSACAVLTRCSPPNHASAPRRSRRSAAKATTGSPLHWLPATRGIACRRLQAFLNALGQTTPA